MGILENINSLITTETAKYEYDMPIEPYNCICLYNTTSMDSTMNLNKESIFKPIITLRVRDRDSYLGEDRIKAIITALNGITNTSVNGQYFISIILYNNYNCLGRDNVNNWIYECEFKIQTHNL